MPTILETVYDKVPFLASPTDDIKIGNEVERTQIYLQSYLLKDDTQVFDEASYTEIEKLLVAYLSAYNISQTQAFKNLAGANGNAPTPTRHVKKAKADVVETEFADLSSKNSLILSAQEVANELKKLVCETAYTIGIILPMCGFGSADSVAIGFQIFE